MASPAVFQERALWYESQPSVLATVTKCKSAKNASGQANPITVVYLPHRQYDETAEPHVVIAPGSPHQTTREEVQQVRSSGRRVGLYTEVRWFPPGPGVWTDVYGSRIVDPIAFRKAVSRELLDYYAIGDPVMFDWEKMRGEWLLAFLLGTPPPMVGVPGTTGWRGKDGKDNGGGTNPGRPFAWTDASFQQGNYSEEVLGLLDKFGAAFFCQLYYGGMQPVVEREDAIREFRDRGFPGIDVLPMYDADVARQPGPNNWRKGCIFTSNRWVYLFT